MQYGSRKSEMGKKFIVGNRLRLLPPDWRGNGVGIGWNGKKGGRNDGEDQPRR